MGIQSVKQYFDDWTSGDRTAENYRKFVRMLQSKATFLAGSERKTVICFHDTRTKGYIEDMLITADDNRDELIA